MRRRVALGTVIVTSLLAAACGTSGGNGDGGVASTVEPTGDVSVTPTTRADVGPIALASRAAPSASPATAGYAVTAFGFDIYGAAAQTASPADNLVLSPLSIAIALAMLEPGANDQALAQLHDLLRIDDPSTWHASMNALEQDLEARVAELPDPAAGEDQDPGEFEATIANAGFLAPGYPFVPAYLDTIGTNYGAVLEELDFTDAEAAAARINEFIAEATDDHITDLVKPTDVDPDTVLALVNALLLRASWLSTFGAAATADQPFTRIDGTTVDVAMMHGRSDHSGEGDGWVGASKTLVGNVRLDVVLPDEGRFDEVMARIDEIFGTLGGAGGALAMPRFETRVTVALTDALRAAGLTAPFEQGQLMGIANDPKTQLDKALHQAWISVDEDGIEAAAATVLMVVAVSEPIGAVDVVLDRPFVFRIVDEASGATLFLGRIMDPTA